MIWIVLIGILGFVGIKFFTALTKDDDDLQNQTLAQKFSVIVNIINQAAFNGGGKITLLDKREFNLYKEDENQIIKFHYSTGSLTITWKYKYFQKEVVHEKQLDNVRNLSVFDQERIARNVVTEMATIVGNHKQEVIKPVVASISAREKLTITLKATLEDSLRGIINSSLNESKSMPEMMLGLIVMQAAGSFCETYKNLYTKLKTEYESKSFADFVSKEEYDNLVDQITSDVLKEYIDMPEGKDNEQEDSQYYY